MDLGSTTGTSINNLQIPALQWCDIKPLDEICFGSFKTKFNIQQCEESLMFSTFYNESRHLMIKSDESRVIEFENLDMSRRITRRMKQQMVALQDKCIDLTKENVTKFVVKRSRKQKT